MKNRIFILFMTISFASLVFAEIPDGKMVSKYDNPDIGGQVSASLVPETTADYWITATPLTGYEFLYWSDGIKTNPRQMTFTDEERQQRIAKKYYAVFAKTSDIHVSHGEVTVSVVDMPNKTYSLLASPLASASCAILKEWTNGSSANPVQYIEGSGTMAPTMIIRDLLYQRHDAADCYIQVSPLTCGYSITAMPGADYKFVKWTDDETVTTPVRVVEHNPQICTAMFAQGAAIVGDQSYETIQDAIDNSNGNEVIIIGDAVLENITITNSVTISGGGYQIGDLTILNGGKLTLSSALEVENLYLNTTTGNSSQLVNQSLLSFANAYVDIQLEAGQSVASPDKWYAFAVPFDVNVLTGVHRKSAPDATLVNGTDYLIWEYDGELRAATTNGWIEMGEGTMKAGNFYMIGIDGDENIWRFTKSSNDPLVASNVLNLKQYPASSPTEQGWNAVANSTLQFADAAVQSGIYIAQVYENGADVANYKVKNLTANSFVMSSPFFIQTAGNDVLTFSGATHNGALLAPNRVSQPKFYSLHLGSIKDNEFSEYDVVYGTVSEDSKNEYVIGKDVVKMIGASSTANAYPYPYMYINAYNLKLCAQETQIIDGTAEYSINIYSPASSSYSFRASEGELLKDGVLLWNFANGDCHMPLVKGINYGYTYRVKRTPGVATDLAENTKSEGTSMKFIQENQLLIKVNGQLYNVQGERLE